MYVDPDILYMVQGDGTSSIANVGVAYDVEADGTDHTGSATFGRSASEIDLSDTGTGQFMVVGLYESPDNAWGASSKLVVFNNVPLMA